MYIVERVVDFVDPDIEGKLLELEREEAELSKYDNLKEFHDPAWHETATLLTEMHSKIELQRIKNRLKRSGNKAPMPRPKQRKSIGDATRHLKSLGYYTHDMEKRVTARARQVGGGSRRSLLTRNDPGRGGANLVLTPGSEGSEGKQDMEIENVDKAMSKRQVKTLHRRRALACTTRNGWRKEKTVRIAGGGGFGKGLGLPGGGNLTENSRVMRGFSHQKDLQHAEKLKRFGERQRNKKGYRGEADRFIGTKKPKHLYSGKRGKGKTDWR